MSDKKGVIYILTNPSFPDYVKIGCADDIDKRLKQLNRSECIPFAFRVYATYEVNSRLSDLKLHTIIDKLSGFVEEERINVENLRSRIHIAIHKNIFALNLRKKEDDALSEVAATIVE